MRLTKGNVTIRVHTRFDLTGRVSDASLRHVGVPSARQLFTSAMGAVPSIGGLSTGARTQEGLQHISEANLKHGLQTKDKLAA